MAHFKDDSDDEHLDPALSREHHSLGRGLGASTTPHTPGGTYALPTADSTNTSNIERLFEHEAPPYDQRSSNADRPTDIPSYQQRSRSPTRPSQLDKAILDTLSKMTKALASDTIQAYHCRSFTGNHCQKYIQEEVITELGDTIVNTVRNEAVLSKAQHMSKEFYKFKFLLPECPS